MASDPLNWLVMPTLARRALACQLVGAANSRLPLVIHPRPGAARAALDQRLDPTLFAIDEFDKQTFDPRWALTALDAALTIDE
jgi:hypothetical protein